MTRILGRIDFTKLLHAQRFMGELYGAEVLTARRGFTWRT